MQKKGLLGYKAVIELTIVGLIIAAIIVFPSKLYGSVIGGSEENAAKRNFNDVLVPQVRTLLGNPSSYASDSVSYFMKEGYKVIGFNHDSSLVFKKDEDNDPVEKPPSCDNQACLCLYEDTIEKTGDKSPRAHLAGPCKTFEGNTYFFGSLSDQGKFQTLREDYRGVKIDQQARNWGYVQEGMPDRMYLSPEYLMLYGKGGFDTVQLFIEKYENNGNTFVMITPLGPDMEARKNYLKTCSDTEDTDEKCRNQKVNTVFQADSGELRACLAAENSDRCYSREIERCGTGEISDECACGGERYTEGYCTSDGTHYTYKCSELEDCRGYCDPDSDSSNRCTPQEKEVCESDPCGFGCVVESVSVSTGGIGNLEVPTCRDAGE